MKFETLDLTSYCNHKLIYEKMPDWKNSQEEYGLDNIFILKQEARIQENDVIEGVNFNFSLSGNDNIVCNGQEIFIGKNILKLHLICFAYWGDTNEYFKVTYEDGESEILKVPFVDWSHPFYKNYPSYTMYGKEISSPRFCLSSGEKAHLIYFHHVVCECTKNKKIKKIILPNNMFTHIFAMTLENENCHIEKQNQED